MNQIFKYIIVDTGVILFNENTTHSQVGKGFKKVYAAGFVKVDLQFPGSLQVYGESKSLGIKSQQKDAALIFDFLKPVSQVKYGLLSVKEAYKTK